ncbi:MAG: hypothetical protein ABI167_09050 [Nitrosospira sp.]
MATSDLPRHQLIKHLMAPHGASVADASIVLWERMAAEIISIVGEEGFNSLYARSLFLSHASFPWLANPFPKAEHRFAELKTKLEGHAPAPARKANTLLLITFTDVLASLIGESLTTRILHLAWGAGIPARTGKENQE